jgi:DNA replication protein DnaC
MKLATLENQCVLSSKCKLAGNEMYCNFTCFPHTLMHGLNSESGLWKSTRVPKRYRNSFLRNLPIKEQNPEAYAFVKRYITKIIPIVEQGIGLYLYSIPSKENRRGTGTGKTTVATAILNEFMIERVIQYSKGGKEIVENPGIFIKASELQNTFNAQFRGTDEMKEQASIKFKNLQQQMLKAELLVFDDIALRGTTEAYQDVFYEIIDKRYNEELATVFTSNTPLEQLGEVLNYQIASRIEGMTEAVSFEGKDNRKGGIL